MHCNKHWIIFLVIITLSCEFENSIVLEQHSIKNIFRSFIEWNVTVQLPDSGVRVSRTRLLSSTGQGPLLLVVDMILFVIMRTSTIEGLTSTLSANVTTDLNGTDIQCSDIGASRDETSTSVATIHVITGIHNIIIVVTVFLIIKF
jgi:hypothetical protein